MENTSIDTVALSPIDKDGNVNLTNIPEGKLEEFKALGNELSSDNSQSILTFGAEIENAIARQSDTFLTSVRVQHGGEVGEHINELLAELNYIDVDELHQNFFEKLIAGIPLLKNLITDVKQLFQKYDKIVVNVERISNKVKAGMINSVKDNAALQTMFDNNLNLIAELEKYIIAGHLKFKALKEELAEMEANPNNYKDYEISDKRNFITRLDKRLADLKVVRYILLQSLAQIRIVQENNTNIAEKAQSILTTTLPVWKNQLALAVALQRQRQHIEVQKKVSETTNTILQKNAEMLKQNSIETAKENEKTIVSLETLQTTTRDLIDTLTEVKQIHEQGEQSRRVLDAGLQSLEAELRKGVTGQQ